MDKLNSNLKLQEGSLQIFFWIFSRELLQDLAYGVKNGDEQKVADAILTFYKDNLCRKVLHTRLIPLCGEFLMESSHHKEKHWLV